MYLKYMRLKSYDLKILFNFYIDFTTCSSITMVIQCIICYLGEPDITCTVLTY